MCCTRWLADLVLVVHGLFILFVLMGGLLTLRWPRVAWLHVPAALWGVGIELTGGICPLTPLENHFRRLAGEQGYARDFVEHYVVALLYPPGLTRQVQWLLAALVLAANVGVYSYARRRARAKRASV